MKKLGNLILAAALVLVCLLLLPTEAQAASTSDLTFTPLKTSSGIKYSVTDCDTSATGDLTIPATYYGIPVIAVGDSAFQFCTSLTSVTVPDSVTTIGDYAFFYCDSLTSVTIPDSVTSIGDDAFYGCWNLLEFNVNKDNPVFSSDNCGVLFDKGMATLIQAPYGISGDYTIPDSVTTIGDSAFDNCNSLTSITIPDSVTTIGDSAFYSCDGLIGIWVNENNPNYSSDSYGVLFYKDKTTLITAPGAIASYTIPDSVTTIGQSAFDCCRNLTSITIPDSVTAIGNYVFCNCDSLTSITIPDSVTAIGNYVFCNCDSLTIVTIGNSVTTIGDFAFSYCTSLTSVTIPDSVTTIGLGAFSFCSNLTDVYYTGTQEQWDGITIDSSNEPLPNATLHLVDYCTAYGHTEVIIPGKAATCMRTGLTDGKICSACEAVLQAQEIIPVGDHAEVVIPGEPATCTASGISDGVGCEDCGEILVYPEEIPALGHTKVVVPGYAATCTTTGLTDGEECSTCGKVYIEQTEIPATGHTEESVSGYAPTCTETGLTDGKKCSDCGEILLAQETISATGHTEEIIPGQAPTCTENGLADGKKCSVCGEILLEQEVIPATGHTYDHDFDADCNACGITRTVTGNYRFINYRVVFTDDDETHMNHRAVIYKLGDKTVADPTDETALQAIDPSAETAWGVSRINKILLTDAGNYVVLLKYNVGTDVVKAPMVLNVTADPKLIIDKNNKITAIDDDSTNINHRVVVYYLGENTVEDIYDEAALKAIDSAPETHWQKTRINRLALTKDGNYVLHLCYNKAGSDKITVAQQFTVFAIPAVQVNINNKLVVREENAENCNHRATVFYLGEGTVEDPFDETEVKAAAVSSKTYWGVAAINKAEITIGGNYVVHLYYNVGTSEKRTLALDVTVNERPALSISEDNKLVVTYTDSEINNLRAYIYNVGDADVEDIYDEAALKAIATPTQVWGLSSINKKQLTSGTYVIHLYYSVGTSAKKTVALKVTI